MVAVRKETEQLRLFGQPQPESWKPLARRDDPESSKESAQRLVESGQLKGQKQAVYLALRRFPGSTSAELAKRADLTRHLTGRRLPDLERAGLVRRGDLRPCSCGKGRAVTWWPVEQT